MFLKQRSAELMKMSKGSAVTEILRRTDMEKDNA
jgi:hypothetical protein